MRPNIRPNPKSKVFYQHPYQGCEHIFAGDLETSEVPSFHLNLVMDYYQANPDSFHFYLVLKNGIELSIYREWKNQTSVSVMQIMNGHVTKNPVFPHDGFGETMIAIDEFQDFVVKLSKMFPQVAYIKGEGEPKSPALRDLAVKIYTLYDGESPQGLQMAQSVRNIADFVHFAQTYKNPHADTVTFLINLLLRTNDNMADTFSMYEDYRRSETYHYACEGV